jgi:spermidine synthase
MSVNFEELDYRPTSMGALSLRRRRQPSSGTDVYEIKLDDEFLMSSLHTSAEIALARLGLAASKGTEIDVVVGGLGLGYTAQAVLENSAARSLIVIDALAEVIEWHERGLLPLGEGLIADRRCRLVHGDFFAMSASAAGLDPAAPGRRFDAVLVDIDHAPGNWLHPGHASFYQFDGLRKLSDNLRPGGVFALWSNDPPDPEFGAVLAGVFPQSQAHIVTFHNPLWDREATNTVYVAVKAARPVEKAVSPAAI